MTDKDQTDNVPRGTSEQGGAFTGVDAMTIKATVAKLKERLASKGNPYLNHVMVPKDDLSQLIAHTESQDARIEAQNEEIVGLHECLSRYISGDCACPKRLNDNPKASHFPGCPMVAQERIEALEAECARVKALVPRWIPVSERLPDSKNETVWFQPADNSDSKTRHIHDRMAVERGLPTTVRRTTHFLDGVPAFPATTPQMPRMAKFTCNCPPIFEHDSPDICGQPFHNAEGGSRCTNLVDMNAVCSHSKACHGEKP